MKRMQAVPSLVDHPRPGDDFLEAQNNQLEDRDGRDLDHPPAAPVSSSRALRRIGARASGIADLFCTVDRCCDAYSAIVLG